MKVYSILITLMVFGVAPITVSQTSNNYYRSKTSGRWDISSTWETSTDKVNWTDAVVSPDYKANTITVREGHTISVMKTVIVDQTIIEAGAVLIVNPPGSDSSISVHIANGADAEDMTVYGTIIATGIPSTVSPYSVNTLGVLSFESGSLYDHNQNGGAIPLSTWKEGSTMKLSGVVDVRPANREQNFANITVDLPQLTVNINMGFQDNIISGDINILNTNTHRWVLVGPQTDVTRTVTIMGNIYLHNGNFNTHGTENPNSHAVVHTYGDVIVTGGNFSICRASQGFTGTTTWYLHGDLSISNAVTQNANPVGAKFVFTDPGEHKLTLDNVTYGAGGLPIQVDGTTLNLGTSTIRESGMFNVTPGSVLICANEGGIDSAIQTSGPVTLSSEADYVFNGTVAQLTGNRLPSVVKNLIIQNPSSVLLSNDVQVNGKVEVTAGHLLLNGRTLTLGSNAELVETGGEVTGISGKIITTRDINSPDRLNAGNIGAVITSSANLGTTTIERFHSPVNINGTQSIFREYKITPENNSDLNATLRIYYLDSELDTINEGNLRIFSSQDGTGNSWGVNNGIIDTEENYAEISGLDRFSFWTLAPAGGIVSVEDEINQVPEEYSLYQNYPNPFNPETVIKFDLPEESDVNLSVYNALGEKVLTIIDEKLGEGKYTRTLNASSLPSGMYIYRMSAGTTVFTKKMMFLK